MRSVTNTSQSVHALAPETDVPLPQVYEKRGSNADMFHKLFEKTSESVDPPIKVETSSYYVVGGDAEHPDSLGGGLMRSF